MFLKFPFAKKTKNVFFNICDNLHVKRKHEMLLFER